MKKFSVHWKLITDLTKTKFQPVQTTDGQTISLKLISDRQVKTVDNRSKWNTFSSEKRMYNVQYGEQRTTIVELQEPRSRYTCIDDFTGSNPDDLMCLDESDNMKFELTQ